MFKLSKQSLKRLKGVKDPLVDVVKRAIEITDVDFGVSEGLRTTDRQRELVNKGASKTLNSRHITGHAVDLVAYVGPEVRYDWPLYYKIAEAMQTAAKEIGVNITWGGAWNQSLTDSKLKPEDMLNTYVAVRLSENGKPFLDGPHFELSRKDYP